jgi:HEAT repeat protein
MRALSTLPLFVMCLAASLAAQQVILSTGEVLAGTVASVAKNRAKLQLADGSLRQVDVRSIDCARTAHGTVERFPATLLDGPIAAAPQALLARLQAGALQLPELIQLTDNCTTALLDELKKLTAAKAAAVRAQAARALAMAATKESVRAALDAALADGSGALLREVAYALTSGACLAALGEADARADVEKGLTSKDKVTRYSCAWIAAKLGSTDAPPVLATFVADSDHHVRESAATCLAECGDAAGAKLLIAICKRERSPAMDANRDVDAATKELVARGARRERIHCCQLLGSLKHAPAVPTLTALAKHKDAGIAEAAQAALKQIEAAR